MNDYHFGEVEGIQQIMRDITEPDTNTGEIEALMIPDKRNTAWRDHNCPLNFIFLNVGQSGMVEKKLILSMGVTSGKMQSVGTASQLTPHK